MPNYEKLSISTRTRTALLLLLLFMVLAVADLIISFFGGLVLGVLLVQFELEAQRFLSRFTRHLHHKGKLNELYQALPLGRKMLVKAALQVLTVMLILTGVLDAFWGGILSGILLALLLDDLMNGRKVKAAKVKQQS